MRFVRPAATPIVAGPGPAAEAKRIHARFAEMMSQGELNVLRRNPKSRAKKETAASNKKQRQRAKRKTRISKNAVIHQGINSFEPFADV